MTRIGLVDQSSEGWTGGRTYTRMLASLLNQGFADGSAELFLISHHPEAVLREDMHFAPIPLTATRGMVSDEIGSASARLPFRGEVRLRRLLRRPRPTDAISAAEKFGMSVILPLLDLPPWKPGVPSIGWVPDLQHVALPELFSASELQVRDRSLRHLIGNARHILVSSAAARRDLVEYAPECDHLVRILRFPSVFAFEPPTAGGPSAIDKYGIPERFALVANQFWRHKNHIVVVRAAAELARDGIDVPIVMTGMPADFRDPQNRTLSALLQEIAMAGLPGRVVILGQVDRADLIGLMRAATVVIQPSKFEGWSTVVQDANALGRPLICSDLPVHREQAPDAIGFFHPDDPGELARIILRSWSQLPTGPDEEAEELALRKERMFANEQAGHLRNLCITTAATRRSAPWSRKGTPAETDSAMNDVTPGRR